MAPIFRLIAICPIALWIAGCAPNTDTAGAGAGTAIGVTTQEQITVTDGIRTREIHEVRNGIREIILQENQKAGQLHGEQRRFAKGMLIEEVHYENGKQTEVKDQEWLTLIRKRKSRPCRRQCTIKSLRAAMSGRSPATNRLQSEQQRVKFNARS
jgi:hypothetical protein